MMMKVLDSVISYFVLKAAPPALPPHRSLAFIYV
jgi:hypothetical protein